MTVPLSSARLRAIGFGAVILMSAGCSGGQAQSGAPITKAPAALRHQTVVREPYEPRAEARRNEPGLIRLDEHISKECFSPDPVATPQRLLSWKFDKDSEGWTRTDGSPLVSVDGRVRFTVDALNPGILSPVIDAPIRELITVEVMLSVSGGERIRFYWSGALPIPTDTTSGSSFWSSLTFWKTPSIPWTKQFSVADSIAPGNEIQRFALRSSPLRQL